MLQNQKDKEIDKYHSDKIPRAANFNRILPFALIGAIFVALVYFLTIDD